MNDIITAQDISVLMRLLLAHILADFFLQSKAMVTDRSTKHWKSTKMIYHVLIHAVLVYVVLWEYTNVWPAVLVLISHYLIDLVKSYQKESIYSFLADQLSHIAVLVFIWMIIRNIGTGELIQAIIPENKPEIWIYLFAFVFVTWPVGILISKSTYNWQSQLTLTKGLPDAGKWIGIFERVLILIFVLVNQYAGIGFLIAAKSVLRFNDIKNPEYKKEAEYILIGTMLSFTVAIASGLALKALIGNLIYV
ncbi:MAG: DUF3307 domain-containing protein [Bacteroidales bacterium]|nr:DUF3307 domain-containing protein [Bacteroidales bacterium]MCF8455409.1 DUF3307 domain-containing protein [Bacteroidales bacterium]